MKSGFPLEAAQEMLAGGAVGVPLCWLVSCFHSNISRTSAP